MVFERPFIIQEKFGNSVVTTCQIKPDDVSFAVTVSTILSTG